MDLDNPPKNHICVIASVHNSVCVYYICYQM